MIQLAPVIMGVDTEDDWLDDSPAKPSTGCTLMTESDLTPESAKEHKALKLVAMRHRSGLITSEEWERQSSLLANRGLKRILGDDVGDSCLTPYLSPI